jgi:hypothetical protein
MRQINIMKFREASPASRESWLSMIVRVFVIWVSRPRAPRPPKWHDSDGAHRGL